MRLLKQFLILASLLLGVCIFNGCNGWDTRTLSEEFADNLNSHYGYYPDERYTLIREHGSESPSHCVVYDSYWGTYTAYDMDYYSRGMYMGTFLGYDSYDDMVVIPYLDPNVYSGYYYSHTYDIYFEEDTTPSNKDLEKLAAFKEERKIHHMGKKMAKSFGLSQERGIKVAHMVNEWNTAKNQPRGLTDKDINSFAVRLLGFDMNKAEKAYKKSHDENDSSDFEALFDEAAKTNGMQGGPEQVKKIFKELVKDH